MPALHLVIIGNHRDVLSVANITRNMQRRGTGIQHDNVAILNQRRRALADPLFRAEIDNFAIVRRLFKACPGTKNGSAVGSGQQPLLFQLAEIGTNGGARYIKQVIDAGKQAGALVILNPAPWQPVEHALLRKVDLLTPNATEAGLMTGRRVDSLTAAAEAADVLHAQGARNVIITLGASGALLSEHGVKSPIPCFPSHPRDTTGAGDAFNGALAARLACGEPLQAAARFAAAYAAVSVEKQGASSLPEYLEAQERLLRAAADYEMA